MRWFSEAARGAAVGVPAPLHAQVNELVKKVERGELAPSPGHIANL
jgi:hypothetical protein